MNMSTLERIAKNDPDVTSLDEMYVTDAYLEGLVCMKGNTHVTNISVIYSNVGNVDSLEGNTTVTSIELENVDLRDIRGLKGMTQLTYLKLSGNSFSDTSPIEDFVNLTYLDVSGTSVKSISFLKNLTRLEELDISGIPVEVDVLIPFVTRLNELHIVDCVLTDETLSSLFSKRSPIVELNVSYNSLSNLKFITNLPYLETIQAISCKLTDISALACHPSIGFAYLDENHISDVSCLRSNTTLRRLDIQDNNIRDLSALFQIPTLNTLVTDRNPIDPESLNALFLNPNITCCSIYNVDDITRERIGRHIGTNSHNRLPRTTTLKSISLRSIRK